MKINSIKWQYILLMAVLISFCHGCITQSKVIGYIANHSAIKDSILAANPCKFTVDSIIAAKVDTGGLVKFLQDNNLIYRDNGGNSLPFVIDTAYIGSTYIPNGSIGGNGSNIRTVRYNRTIDTAKLIAGLARFYTPKEYFLADERSIVSLKNLVADKCEVISGLNANISDADNTISKLEQEKNKGWYWAYGTWAALFVILVGLILWRIYGIKL